MQECLDLTIVFKNAKANYYQQNSHLGTCYVNKNSNSSDSSIWEKVQQTFRNGLSLKLTCNDWLFNCCCLSFFLPSSLISASATQFSPENGSYWVFCPLGTKLMESSNKISIFKQLRQAYLKLLFNVILITLLFQFLCTIWNSVARLDHVWMTGPRDLILGRVGICMNKTLCLSLSPSMVHSKGLPES